MLVSLSAAILILFSLTNALNAQSCDENLRVSVEAVYDELSAFAEDESQPLAARVEAQQRITGAPESSLLQLLEETDPDAARNLYGQYLIKQYLFDDYLDEFATNWSSETIPAHYFNWLFLTEDLPGVNELTENVTAQSSDDPLLLVERGKLRYVVLQREEAEQLFRKAQPLIDGSPLKREAVIGLARIYAKNREYQRAMDSLCTLVDVSTLNADVLFEMGTTLIRLGRTAEAIDMFEEAVRWNPKHRMAHYYLGNGYARSNYTQLWDSYDVDCGDKDLQALFHAESLIAKGEWKEARALLFDFIADVPNCPRALVMMGSVEWTLGHYIRAVGFFEHALKVVPGYGRAHNGVARALQSYMREYSIYRESDEKIFDEAPMPEIPGIENYILNWASLSPRHRKQVALAVEPWKNYLPVLNESGSHHYIKPLHQMLSECPNLGTIADQRISYDSRLWDDVRGCGGYTTVTGIEDVERSIYFAYNTVLHELTHQVHYTFPPEDLKRVEDIWYAADAREENGTSTYMSRYQASSEYEYLAEGANAMFSPRRNEYDTREVVRERLYEMDPDLVAQVEYFLPAPNIEACYPVGLIRAAEDAIENRKLELADVYTNRAALRDSVAEVVLSMQTYLSSLLDEDEDASRFADLLIEHYPQKARSYARKKMARFFSGATPKHSIEIIRSGLKEVDESERLDLLQDLGDALLYAGQYAEAIERFEKIIEKQANDDAALRGLANALAGAQKFTDADTVFQKAVKRRSGVVDLRLDYARMLIHSNRLDDAQIQIEEAGLLSPEDGTVSAYQGWLAMKRGDHERAHDLLFRALDLDPDYRLSAVLATINDKALNRTYVKAPEYVLIVAKRGNDIPEWQYIEQVAGYRARKTWPYFLISLANSL